MVSTTDNINELVEKFIKSSQVVIFVTTTCPFCTQVRQLFQELNIEAAIVNLTDHKNGAEIRTDLTSRTGQRTVPYVFIKEQFMGGCSDIMKLYHDTTLFQLLEEKPIDEKYDFDLIVIGGGSGGIAAAKEAAKLGKKVALFDFVKPTQHGIRWGVGGTCVNVGCIPKKLMHQASILGELFEDSGTFGWHVNVPGDNPHSWNEMITNINRYIKKLNFDYLKYFRQNKITYFNAHASFIPEKNHSVKSVDSKNVEKIHTAKVFIMATGGRPKIPSFPGSELAITSDDLFWLKDKPGKTLIVGASYIALECAGFLHGLKMDVTVMVRSILLRGFDQGIAKMIGADMEKRGIKFLKGFLPQEIISGDWNQTDPSVSSEKVVHKLKVIMKSTVPNKEGNHETIIDYYDTVLLAVGRVANVAEIGLETTGVILDPMSEKVVVDKYDSTTSRGIYAIGDIQHGRMELTPVAIKAGQRLAKRIFSSGPLMDYDNIPTTVFTPLEYGCCGLSEEVARETYGKDNIEVFHRAYQPLEWAMQQRSLNRCYAKLVCNKSDGMRVLGFHVLGPNAGEITQGFSIAIKMKAKKSDFDSLVGIHPTCAEVFTSLGTPMSQQPDPVSASESC